MNIQDIIYEHLKSEDGPDLGVKNVTVRLSYQSYAELSVLSKRLGVSVSGLLKQLSESSISEALEVYVHAVGTDVYSEFAEEIQDIVDATISAEGA